MPTKVLSWLNRVVRHWLEVIGQCYLYAEAGMLPGDDGLHLAGGRVPGPGPGEA